MIWISFRLNGSCNDCLNIYFNKATIFRSYLILFENKGVGVEINQIHLDGRVFKINTVD